MAAIKGYTPITELLMLGFEVIYQDKDTFVSYRLHFHTATIYVHHHFHLKRGAVYRGTLYKGQQVSTDRLNTLLSKVTRSMKRIEDDQDV